MTRFAAELSHLIEQALANLRLPAGQIADQLSGRQVAPAAPGSPGVVDLDAIPAISSATPQPTGTAAPGTSGEASDAGHVHALSAHAASHASGGSDALSLAASQLTSGVLSVARIPTAPSFRVARASNSAAYTTDVRAKLLWTDEVSDTDDVFDLTNSRTRTLAAGTWLFVVSVLWYWTSSIAGAYIEILIYANGALIDASPGYAQPAIAGYYGATESFQIKADGSTYYEVYVRQGSGANQVVFGNASKANTVWRGVRIG